MVCQFAFAPSAEWYFVFFFLQIFAVCENLEEKRIPSTLPQAKKLVLSVVEGTSGSRNGVSPVIKEEY